MTASHLIVGFLLASLALDTYRWKQEEYSPAANLFAALGLPALIAFLLWLDGFWNAAP